MGIKIHVLYNKKDFKAIFVLGINFLLLFLNVCSMFFMTKKYIASHSLIKILT